MKLTSKSAVLTSLALAVILVPTQGTALAATNEQEIVQPDYYACEPGWVYRDTQKQASLQFHKLVSGTSIINKTLDNITVTSTFTGTFSIGAQVSASLGGGWGPINAEVGYNANMSFSWAASEAIQVTIRPHYEGWNDYGVKRDQWYGYYVYVNERCGETSGKWITVKSPIQRAAIPTTKYAYY